MSYTALYRKYRPQTFEEVVGQEHITTTLKNQIMTGRVGHAYLLNGTRGTGKTSSAKILARAINCLNPINGNPCNECEICKAALNGSLTDIVEMDAASNNSVDDVRAIRDEVNFLPTVAKYRVYIIDEVHMLSIGAFNALLKTLEEPPEHVKFILATTEPQKLPSTILSRCQRFDFKKISNEYIKSRVSYICKEDKINIEDEAINTISVFAEGAMRDALSILERCVQEGTNLITNDQVKELMGVPNFEIIYNIVNNMVDYNLEETMNIVGQCLNDGKDVNNLTWEIIKFTKDVLVYKTTQKCDIYSNDEAEKIKTLAVKAEKNRLLDIIFKLSNLANDLRFTTQRTILFEVEIMKLCDKNIVSDGVKVEVKNVSENLAPNVNVVEINNRFSTLETIVKKLIANQKNINTIGKNVDNSSEKSPIKEKSSPGNTNLQNLMIENVDGKAFEGWGKIVSSIKEEGKVKLYANLAQSKAIEINDMTIGICFPEGLTPFGKSVIGDSENIQEITRLISMEFGKPMQFKLIDGNISNKSANSLDSLAKDLDLPLNIID